MKSQEWKGNTGGGLFGQQSLIVLFRFLNVRFGYFLLMLVVPFYMLFARKACRAIYSLFKERFCCSAWKSFCKTYANHYVFGQVILDRFSVFAGRKDLFEIEIVGNEHFSRLATGDKGFVVASSHIGNFEIGGYFLYSDKKKMNALIYAGESEIVQKNRSGLLNGNNINLIPVLNDMSHLFAVNSALQNGEIVSMPCDRNLGSAKNVECDFLGKKAKFPIGAFALATTFDVEVLSAFIIKKTAFKYTVYVMPVEIENRQEKMTKQEKIEQYVRVYVKNLEEIVRKYPEQWFNYYDFWAD